MATLTLITFSFNSGEIQLTSVIDPETKQHLVTCDLCSQVIKLGIRGSITCISQWWLFNCIQLPISPFWDAVQKAAEFSKILQCTNVLINCPLCPTAVSGDPPTIWKYNVLYHLISEHPSGSTPPSIPGQLLV